MLERDTALLLKRIDNPLRKLPIIGDHQKRVNVRTEVDIDSGRVSFRRDCPHEYDNAIEIGINRG